MLYLIRRHVHRIHHKTDGCLAAGGGQAGQGNVRETTTLLAARALTLPTTHPSDLPTLPRRNS